MKKNTENQSSSALALRWKVGSAKLASTASGGSASSMARSSAPISRLVSSGTSEASSGTDRWRRIRCERQRHSDQAASGQAGQQNQPSRRSQSSTLRSLALTRQAQPCIGQATSAASAIAPRIHGRNLRASS